MNMAATVRHGAARRGSRGQARRGLARDGTAGRVWYGEVRPG